MTGFRAQGPHGNSYLAKILEIITVFQDHNLRSLMSSYCVRYNQISGYTPKSYEMSRLEDLFSFLGHDKILSLTQNLKDFGTTSIKSILNPGFNFRLGMFHDGAGKIRYIAIGP
jgi:hypothetical protein